MGWWTERFGLADLTPDGAEAVYCDCGEPTPGFWGLECACCRRLIEGSIGRGVSARCTE